MRIFRRAKGTAIVGMTAAALCGAVVLVPAAQATFPGENGRLAIGSRSDILGTNPEHNVELFTMNVDGSGLTQLTFTGLLPTGAGVENWVADWSPDGGKIVFRSNRDSNNEIYVMNADGSGQTNLSNNPASDETPSWSADGTRIYFYSTRDGNGELYVMNADGSGQTRLTNNPAQDGRPVESPDGKTISFSSTRSGHFAVWTMSLDGKRLRQLTPDALDGATSNWSPDGRMLVFNDNFCGTCPASDIWVVNRNGSGLRKLTSTFGNNLYPFWSPDGEQIAFTHWADLTFPPPDIFTIESDGSGAPVNVTSGAGMKGVYSAWQAIPDQN